MKTKVKFLMTSVLVLMLLVGITGVALADAGPLNIPLQNDTAVTGTAAECTTNGTLLTNAWHFVISPNNGDSYFIVFHLNLGDASTYDTSIFVPNGIQLDNVFVAVPSGKTLTSLIKTGSSADIYWNGDGGTPTKFQLSHVCSGGEQPQDLTVTKTATPSFTRTFNWTIDKSADKDTVYSAGGGESGAVHFTIDVTKDGGTDSDWAVSGTITVHNPNTSLDVNGVSLSDATPGGTCTVTPASVDVAAGSDATADYTCTFASNPGSGTNTATGTWADFGSPNTSAQGTADYTFSDPTNVVNDEIDVTDTNGGSWHFTHTDSVSYDQTYTDPAGKCTSHENTATITGGDSDSASVQDCQGADLTVSKTANPSFKRTFSWGITKDVTPKLVEQVGGTATFNYTVTVTKDSGTDSDWAVSGNIHVANPNDWEAITADVTDALSGGNCSVTGGSQASIPASGSVDFPYTCTFSSNPGSGTNTGTATWDASAAHTPDSSASGDAPFAFGAPTTVLHDCVTVTDPNSTNPPLPNTTCASKTYNYSKTVNVPQFDCITYNNTATFVATDDSSYTGHADQSVKVCGPAKTGALTMGFWQNKNGQGIITGGASTAGVCNSGTWLRQYAPFQDLSATATCAQVATYVTNVIKAANASGSSMNAMLKAQMLATSLDVYFSSPALGGNKINAPAPIGGVTIDLTKICKMIDGSGGTATCSGTYQNVSAAFGGATSLTVSQMLAYAASQSNAGGSTWYANVKATQELAKNAFDAINNQVAFAP